MEQRARLWRCKCLPQSLDFILNGYQGDTEGFKYRSDRASSVCELWKMNVNRARLEEDGPV